MCNCRPTHRLTAQLPTDRSWRGVRSDLLRYGNCLTCRWCESNPSRNDRSRSRGTRIKTNTRARTAKMRIHHPPNANRRIRRRRAENDSMNVCHISTTIFAHFRVPNFIIPIPKRRRCRCSVAAADVVTQSNRQRTHFAARRRIGTTVRALRMLVRY